MSDLVATTDVALLARNVTKSYRSAEGNLVPVLHGIDLVVARGEMVAIMGRSGSGKSTLLNVLAGLDRPDEGSIQIGGTEITDLSERALTRMRRTRIGFVFQSFNLLPHLSAEDNILLPLDLARRRPDPERFEALVETLGLTDRLAHRPAELSGGQQQRVAVARALLSRPDIILADEPTGALDEQNASDILALLRDSTRDGQSVVLVTHDRAAAQQAHRIVTLPEPLAQGDTARSDATPDLGEELHQLAGRRR